MSEEKITIENCKLAFECPLEWDSLIKTERDDVMYCSKCDRGVHLCKTDAELSRAKARNQCVAIVRVIASPDGGLTEESFIGEITPKYEISRAPKWD